MAEESLFGTDGIRGRAGDYPLITSFLEFLGETLAGRLQGHDSPGKVLVGHDGRESGEPLAAAIAKGLNRGGIDVDLLGLAPTPCIAYLTGEGPYKAGIVISASHNPATDNGIKLLSETGTKFNNAEEKALSLDLEGASLPSSSPSVARGITSRKDILSDYLSWMRTQAFPQLDFSGRKIVIDCANGAWSQFAPRVLSAFGADPVVIHNKPNGANINAGCGSLHPEIAAATVIDENAFIGLSLDGDGDRALLADEKGRILDGDALLAGLARSILPTEKNTVVATVMSNLALERWMQKIGGKLVRTPVGDRYVAETMQTEGHSLGGEKSGHLLFGEEHSFRGDGIYTLLKVAEATLASKCSASSFFADYRDFPQSLRNLPVTRRPALEELPFFSLACKQAEETLEGKGRIVTRYSGTENCLRIMAEAETQELVEAVLDSLQKAADQEGILSGTK
ncbi:MAG TPA: phosphoglucosamine mutase [Planctomycetes bacterium]|nr:phosphoglucosamine mutase [Planctomycetota bacterium]